MATNYKSSVSAIAEEVAALLRHNNIDTRIYGWIAMAYADVIQRLPLDFFQEMVTETIDTGTATEPFTTQDTVGTPMALVIKNATHYLYVPQYVTPADYSRITVDSSDADATVPRVWTIMQNATPADALFIWPGASGAFSAHLFHIAPGLTSVPAGGDYLPNIPYHFEDVIIWGAAAIGATLLRTASAPIYQQEYEEAILSMASILGYKPDATPVFQSITGAYAGALQSGAKFPETIG